MGAGKTRLAQQLAADLQTGLLKTDNFSFKRLYPERAHDHLDGQPYLNCLVRLK